MSADERSDRVSFYKVGNPAARRYEVRQGDSVVGIVQRMQMGAGQFGTTWSAFTDSGHRRANFRTREAAASWLLSLG